MNEDLFIWWTSDDDCRKIAQSLDSQNFQLPEYIKSQFRSRFGRSGRGRLWIDHGEIKLKEIPWDDTKPICKRAAECGGIVIHVSDLTAVVSLPGFVSDLNMDRIVSTNE